ncbi:MAG: hypothetical protein COV52_02915 [Gammaproteobacteria bacterium CG11_big_fil_rev_8_21_14_0_20_46_22]|nr:MAG: hypothetical protein COW05_02145 [Gammaproteobacteria bacterium CG12_big_fil_rev_8_21_14_0_65_46_12]PIR11726.1 MAG: hypothetical protein COV52_02915 [Gammaproteobacteria bacterium CG11_big_fil_rev_8_21_14_0_20_46_22]
MKHWLKLSICLIPLMLAGCSPAPPKNTNNICSIFKEYPNWYWDSQEVNKRWGIPISTLMAIIHQESHFQAGAAPPREKILWIIPWKRPTTAYGYSQAVDGTWKLYKQDTGGGFFTSRDDFGNAADFIGWYAYRAHKRAGIAMNNTYAQYLAYHEGIGGYMRGTYRKKQWLINVARKVQRLSWTYHWQLERCQSSLPKKPWWHVW